MIYDLIYYLVPTLLILIPAFFHVRAKKKASAIHHAVLKEAQEAGLTEPPSLHPVVDLSICMGSGACVRACPEKALGIIKGKGVLINPTHCIGHGACAPACPVGAIKLVFAPKSAASISRRSVRISKPISRASSSPANSAAWA